MDELERRREINDVMRHDLRTRLGIGKGYVAILLKHAEDMTPEQREAALKGLAGAFDRLDEFGRRVLVDEQLVTWGARPQPGEVSVEGLLREVERTYPAVEVSLDPDAPGTITADPVMLREVLDNLVANAVRAAPTGTAVSLRARASGGSVRFEVRDEGGGVTEDDLAVLFTRYGRTGRARADASPGMGLGLSIVARLVEAHGGTYGADLRQGTTFWVVLPVSPAAAASPEPA